MKIPQLKKKPEIKSCHNTTWEDNYSWIHQDNILEVLKDNTKLLPAWLKEKRPDLLNVWISLKREINWKIDKPFNFNKAKLAKVRGKVNKNFPPIANKTAKAINPNIIKNLRPFEIFLDEMLVIKRNRK